MSGIIVNNVARASGTIAATPGGLDWSTAVVTGSTVTVEAGKGYFINTTSNACTVTLPASANSGDQIVLADYARTWATNAVTIDSNGNNFQGNADTYTVDYDTVGQSLNIVYADSTKGWLPVSDDAVAITDFVPTLQRAIFAFGTGGGNKLNSRNLVNTVGVVASDSSGAGTVRTALAAASYGGDKVIFGFGTAGSGVVAITNLVNNQGVIASDQSATTGTAGAGVKAAPYGVGLALFYAGNRGGEVANMRNLVSNTGVVAADASGAGTSKSQFGMTAYGTGTAIAAFGDAGLLTGVSNLVSNTGVVASDTAAVGTAKAYLAAAPYGGDKAIFAFGSEANDALINKRNLITNQGVVGSDQSGAGTARTLDAAGTYGGDKAIFGFSGTGVTNLVNNSGVVASDTSAVGSAKGGNAASGYGYS
jgi:hypothetical protein